MTPHELGQGLLTGLGRTFHFFQGARDAINDMTDPVKILQGANNFGHQLADVLVADPDGHKASGGTLARNMGHGFVDSINPLNKKSAYDTGQATANLAVTVIPMVGEVGALNDLRVGLRAATLSRDAAEAGLKAAETVPEKAAAAAKLRAAEERVAQVKAALREKIPAVRAVRKVKEAGAKVKQKVSTAKAAAKTAQERRGGGSGGLKSSKSSVAIGRPFTARGLAANQRFGPSAKGLHILNEKQLALHHRLVKSSPEGGIIIKPREIGLRDVAKLTEATGHEHAVVRMRDGSRMLIKGDEGSITHIAHMPVKRLIVHSHPGETAYTLLPSGRGGDLDYLWRLDQKRSYIITSGTTTPGIDYWVGGFDNEGYWKVLNTPPMTPVGGRLPYVKGPQSKY